MQITRLVTRISSQLTHFKDRFKKVCKEGIFVFNYHETSDHPSKFSKDYSLNVPPELFRTQLSWIKGNFNVIDANQLIENRFELPAALITFDDGFASTFREGGPILEDLGLPSTVFMNMAPVYGEIFWSGLITYLINYSKDFNRFILQQYPNIKKNVFLYCKKEDLYEYALRVDFKAVCNEASLYYGTWANHSDLVSSTLHGMTLGNHLYNHYNAVNLSLEELRIQYITNEDSLSKYSNSVKFFSYPFGQPASCYSRLTDELIFSLGASHIFTAFPMRNQYPGARRLHRISMHDFIDSEESFRSQCIVPSLLNKFVRSHCFSYV